MAREICLKQTSRTYHILLFVNLTEDIATEGEPGSYTS